MTHYKAALEELKSRYHNGEVSALIGAGFSKNVFQAFPDWNALLYDMVIELFELEIEDAYGVHLNSSPPEGTMPREAFDKLQVTRLIGMHGYLGIVTLYIKKHGFRESVDLYIEERIPYLDLNEKKIRLKGDEHAIEDNDLAVHQCLLRLGKINTIYTTNYDNILEEVASREENSDWQAVTSSYDLIQSSLKKSIIKIHGDLRKNSSDEFAFDGDHTKRYVISQEDYDSYGEKHEAFMQLMRISLLRESFILLGFSGDDPNFMAWIRWVRDVIIKKTNKVTDTSDLRYYKIFLFSIDDKEPSNAKKQFYINHRIKYIPILAPEFLSLLGISNDDKKISQILIETLNYCTMTYDELWHNVALRHSKKDLNVYADIYDVNLSLLARIRKEKTHNRFIKNTFLQKFHIENCLFSRSIDHSYAQLVAQAYLDTKLPSSLDDQNKALISSLTNDTYIRNLKILDERYEVLESLDVPDAASIVIDNVDEEFDYNAILKAQFSFNFTLLKETLEKWSPNGIRMQNKAVLTNLFNKEEALTLFQEYEKKEPNRQEQVHSRCLRRIFSGHLFEKLPFEKWKKLDLHNIFDIKESLVKEMKEDLNSRSSGSIKFGLEKYADTILSLQLLQLCIDSGAFPSWRPNFFIKGEDWLLISKKLCSFMPCPILWYSMWYYDDDLLRDIVHHMIADDKMRDSIPQILDRLLFSLKDELAPIGFKQMIIKTIPHLLIGVNVHEYEADLMEIWRDFYSEITTSENNTTEFNKSILSIIKYIRNPCYLSKIVESSISLRFSHYDFLIDILIALNLGISHLQSTPSLESMNAIIDELSEHDFYILLHLLYDKLSEQQIERIQGSISNFVTSSAYIKPRPFQALIFFTSKVSRNTKLFNSIKKAIIIHPQLWHNGKSDNRYSIPQPISLSSINLKWNRSDLKKILDALHRSFLSIKPQVEEDQNKRLFFISYRHYVSTIDSFIAINSHNIKTLESNYQEKACEVMKVIISYRGYHDLKAGLMSPEYETVNYAIGQLLNLIRHSSAKNHIDFIIILLDRILHNQQKILLSCLKIASQLTKHYYSEIKTALVTDKLHQILIMYQSVNWSESKLPKHQAYEYLLTIALVLDKHCETSAALSYWLSMQDRYTYNYGRNLLIEE